MAPKAKQDCYILGVGMTKFIKPRGKVDYTELGFEAGIKAMLDAGITYDDVDQGVACYVYGDSTCGQRVFYQFGMTQIPIYNVNNNCSTGSTGLNLARTIIANGGADCILVVGFEKMMPGSLSSHWSDRENPTGTSGKMMAETRGFTNAPGAAQMFGNAGREYMEKYGASAADFAEIARVNHAHSVNNPYSQFQDVYTLAQVQGSPEIHFPLTKLQCCPTSDGGAAAVLCSAAFLSKLEERGASASGGNVRDRAVRIAGMRLATDAPSLFSRSAIDLMGFEMTRTATRAALAEAGLISGAGAADASDDEVRRAVRSCSVVELHDCFSANEMIVLDALGIADPGRAHELVRAGGLTYPVGYAPGDADAAGFRVVNPSGGLISKGHPLGATGIAQAAELVWHLRGWANNRAVPHTRYCLQHNLGLGGAVVVALYERADGKEAPKSMSDAEVGRVAGGGVGYNPATQARGFTHDQARSVRSREHASQWALQDTEKRVEARF